jgi:protein involved in polysaccharide export with SLBB domain
MKKNRLLYLFVLLFTLFNTPGQKLLAQTASSINSINVDELSDDQLKELLQKAQASGIDDNQLMLAAKTRGLSDSQIKALQSRISQIRGQNSVAGSTDTVQQTRRRVVTPGNGGTESRESIINNVGPRVFGADMFNGASTTFEPNLRIATPLNYVLGPDDQININVNGNSVANWKLNVSPEGNINIPGVGVVKVSGKSVEQATAAINSKLAANNYAIGRGTTVQVTLGDIRSIHVIINGEVNKPGTYTLPSLASVFNALYAAGGPNNNGSFRKIEIIRNNAIIRRLDIYDFLLKGDQKDNITLRDQDIIRVPNYRVRVEIAGEIRRPALYEVLPGETLQDVINFSGGFSDLAYTARIKALQIIGQERSITDIYEADFRNYTPLRGDRYVVDRILERYKNRVVINGAVVRPGDYELDKGLTLSGLISKAAGLRQDAFTSRASISRLNADNTANIISFNVKDIINKTAADIPLKNEDLVTISSIFDLRDAYSLTIKGEVRRPGTFAYADNMTVEDLVLKAGGLTQGGSATRIEVSRRVNNTDFKTDNGAIAQVFNVDIHSELDLNSVNFALQPYDIVSVYTSPGFEVQRTVKVEGEVLYPGYYTITKKNERISDLIARAGGITPSAYLEGGTLRRDNNAILGFDKTKVDTSALIREREARFRNLAHATTDSAAVANQQLRNNYVGIDLKKIIQDPSSKTNLLLEDGDLVRVPKQQATVRVSGDVLYPSSIVYTNSKSFKDYVSNAGGFSETARKSGSYIVYPNGTVKATGKFLFFNVYPDVKPGSEIYVPKKQPRRGITTQEVLGITGGLVSVGAVILGILSLSK